MCKRGWIIMLNESQKKYFDLVADLRKRKKNMGVTSADIAEKSGLGLGTVARTLLSANTSMLSFISILDALNMDLKLIPRDEEK